METTIKQTKTTRRITNKQKTLRAIDDSKNNRNLDSVDFSSFEAFCASILDDKNHIVMKSAEEITTSFDEVLDAKYGIPGTKSRETFDNEAFDFVRQMIGEEEFERMMEPELC